MTKALLKSVRTERNSADARAAETGASARSAMSRLHALENANLTAQLGNGRALDSAVRREFEARFEQDFSHVRVHTGEAAATAAADLGAAAFTVGNDIAFGRDAYAPHADDGKALIAHELVHSLQQRSRAVPSGSLDVSAPSDTSEREAQAVASQAIKGDPVQKTTSIGVHVARQPLPSAKPANTVTPPPAPMTRAQFEAEMLHRFQTPDVHTGSLLEQQRMITRHDVTPKPGLTAEMWQSWDPGPASEIYQDIIDGIVAFVNSLGGIPPIQHLIFLKADYRLDANGVAVANPSAGASYGAGTLTIYERGGGEKLGVRLNMPTERSNPKGEYPNAPTLTQTVPGETSGAPVGVPSQRESVKHLIAHELGHGMGEAEYQLNAAIFAEYARAVGWLGSHLFDIGAPGVADAIKRGKAPPASAEITPLRWNDPAWVEQPMSRYSVAGGLSEDFAESVNAYVNNPSALRARSPHRYEFIDSRKAEWRSDMTPPAP